MRQNIFPFLVESEPSCLPSTESANWCKSANLHCEQTGQGDSDSVWQDVNRRMKDQNTKHIRQRSSMWFLRSFYWKDKSNTSPVKSIFNTCTCFNCPYGACVNRLNKDGWCVSSSLCKTLKVKWFMTYCSLPVEGNNDALASFWVVSTHIIHLMFAYMTGFQMIHAERLAWNAHLKFTPKVETILWCQMLLTEESTAWTLDNPQRDQDQTSGQQKPTIQDKIVRDGVSLNNLT